MLGIPLYTYFLLPMVLAACAMMLFIVIRACTRPRRVPQSARCGACGYEFTGWAVCPECGCDAAKSGVVTPHLVLRYRSSIWAAGIALFFLVVLGGMLLTSLGQVWLRSFGFVGRLYYVTLLPGPGSFATPTPPAYQIDMYADMHYGLGEILKSGELYFSPNTAIGGWFAPSMSGRAYVRIDLATKAFETFDTKGLKVDSGTSVGPAHLKKLFQLAGVPTASAAERQSIDDIVQLAMSVPTYRPTQSVPLSPVPMTDVPGRLYSGGSWSNEVIASPFRIPGLSEADSWQVAGLLLTTIMYIVGLRLVVRRRRRLLQEAKARRQIHAQPIPPVT